MMVKRGSYCSSNGIDTISYTVYEPSYKPVGILQIGHGMSEHIGRYRNFADHFTRLGFVVCGNDHLGHGESVASADDFGYFGSEKGWLHLVDDMRMLTNKMVEDYPEIPCFLMGYSMGSLLARAYISCYGEDLSGVILMGTSGSTLMTALTRPLIRAISVVKGERYRSSFLYVLAFGNYTKKYRWEKDRLCWMTQNQEALEQFRRDPKCNFMFTVAGVKDLVDIMKYVSRRRWAQKLPRRLPVLLVSGEMDPVGDYTKGVNQVYRVLRNAGMRDVNIKIYKDSRHELFSEPGKKELYDDIHRWLKLHSSLRY